MCVQRHYILQSGAQDAATLVMDTETEIRGDLPNMVTWRPKRGGREDGYIGAGGDRVCARWDRCSTG
jgi:hypothetical protein